MNHAPASLKSSRAKEQFNLAEIERLVELLPQAAILVNGRSQQVILANNQIVTLSGFSRHEIEKANLPAIFQPAELIGNLLRSDGESAAIELELIRRGRPPVAVIAEARALSLRHKRYLIQVTSKDALMLDSVEEQWKSQIWNYLQQLASNLISSTDLQTAWDLLLRSGQMVTTADALAIYQLQENELGLVRSAALGVDLPDNLPASDLIHLRSGQVWNMHQRTQGLLHRSAREREITCLASAPLGDQNALTGLLVVGWRRPVSQQSCLPMATLLAYLADFVLQEYSRRAHQEQKLRHSLRLEQIYLTLQNAIHDNIVVLDADLRILWLNRAAETCLGYTSDEAAGYPGNSVLGGPENLAQALELACQGVPTDNLQDVRLIRRDGSNFLAQISILPSKVADRLDAILVLFQDLSETERFQVHSQQLEERALLGEVTAVFAHEVRNPINNISTGLQLVTLNLPPQDPNQETLSRLQQDCDRLADLMKSVLAFSRPTDYAMEPLDLGTLVRRLLDRMRPRLNGARVNGVLQIANDLPEISGNTRALEQVLSNLFTNAMQAMSENGGTMTVRIRSLERSAGRQVVEATITDTGPGIPPGQIERIFQPFFTTKSGGTGLGLAITKRIVTAHKGNIQVSSVPGGTVFTLQFTGLPSQSRQDAAPGVSNTHD
jgi:two-component system sensor histidine kinase AtoS